MGETVVIQLSPAKLEELLTNAAEKGAANVLKMSGMPVRTSYTRSEMSRMHGRGRIDRVIKLGLLKPVGVDGSSKLYSELDYNKICI